jgi:hypothetical protein
MNPATKATTTRTMPQLIKTVQALHAKAVQADNKAEQLWITLGIELKEAKARNNEEGELTWPEFAKKHFNFGQSRADELIRIADGRTDVETVRASGAARVQKHAKAKSALANAGTSNALALVDDDEADIGDEDNCNGGKPAYSKKETEERERGSFLLRADNAKHLAFYHCKPERALVAYARATAVAWSDLANRMEISIAPTNEVLQFCNQPMKFVQGFSHRFICWMAANPDLKENDREGLISSLQACADEMSRLAQSLRSDVLG